MESVQNLMLEIEWFDRLAYSLCDYGRDAWVAIRKELVGEVPPTNKARRVQNVVI